MTTDSADESSMPLAGCTIAILVVDGFEQVELTGPRLALEQLGASTRIISEAHGTVQGFNHDQAADRFDTDLTFNETDADEYDAILLPGGAVNSDQIRNMAGAQKLVQDADRLGLPIAVICHGAWLLVSAKLVQGRTMTSWPTLEGDVRSAGGNWVDQEVVTDGNLISSRKPGNIPAFNNALIKELKRRMRENVEGTSDEVQNGMSG